MAKRLTQIPSRLELPIHTVWGSFRATYSPKGLTEIRFPGSVRIQGPDPAPTPQPVARWHRLTTRAVTRILSGKPVSELPPLDIRNGTPFQRSVWSALRRIPLGETRSYGGIAQAIGRPKSSRAVGQACGANPIPLLIPCHRVLAAGAGLGGFSGGLHWKRRLLGAEGVRLP